VDLRMGCARGLINETYSGQSMVSKAFRYKVMTFVGFGKTES
jgi:hypothetical protein